MRTEANAVNESSAVPFPTNGIQSPPPSGTPRNLIANPSGGGRYLDIKEAAHFLGVTTGTLYHWKYQSVGKADPLPFVKFSPRCLRFPSKDLAEWAKRRGDIRRRGSDGKGGAQ